MNDITSFVYELTYAGFKEDIVVEEYTGQTEYGIYALYQRLDSLRRIRFLLLG